MCVQFILISYTFRRIQVHIVINTELKTSKHNHIWIKRNLFTLAPCTNTSSFNSGTLTSRRTNSRPSRRKQMKWCSFIFMIFRIVRFIAYRTALFFVRFCIISVLTNAYTQNTWERKGCLTLKVIQASYNEQIGRKKEKIEMKGAINLANNKMVYAPASNSGVFVRCVECRFVDGVPSSLFVFSLLSYSYLNAASTIVFKSHKLNDMFLRNAMLFSTVKMTPLNKLNAFPSVVGVRCLISHNGQFSSWSSNFTSTCLGKCIYMRRGETKAH